MISTVSFSAATKRRNAERDIEPSGNPSRAAISRRKGVVEVIASRATFTLRDIQSTPFRAQSQIIWMSAPAYLRGPPLGFADLARALDKQPTVIVLHHIAKLAAAFPGQPRQPAHIAVVLRLHRKC